MKKLFILSIAIVFGGAVMAQTTLSSLQNVSAKRSLYNTVDNYVSTQSNPYVTNNLRAWTQSDVIGQTEYDLQSNSTIGNRFHKYADGTMVGVWTQGISPFTNRGTGYNYYSGTTWDAVPTARIEASQRTGWPSHGRLTTGEIIVAHNGTTGLNVATRATYGTGAWTESTFLGPQATLNSNPAVTSTALLWPRLVTVGDTVHVLAVTESDTAYSYQGLPIAIVYSRSTDGGATWDIQNQVLPGMTAAEYTTFTGDSYAFAEPKAGVLAFTVNDSWHDLFYMKSTDGGATWAKTVVYAFPYPMWNETVLTPDTPYCADGGGAIALDNSGMVHLMSGCMRVLNDDIYDGATSYFPFIDGLLYWNESMATVTSMNPDSLEAKGMLHASMVDRDLNGSIFWYSVAQDVAVVPKYYLSQTGMPQLLIDASDNVYTVFSSTMEYAADSGLAEYFDGVDQQYKHLFAKKSLDGGTTWSDYTQLTFAPGLTEYDECVFPVLSDYSDAEIHLIFQRDDQPGLHVRGDEDPYGTNDIVYLSYDKSDIGIPNYTAIENAPEALQSVSVYPNPTSNNTFVNVTLASSANVVVNVTSIIGQNIMTINSGSMSAGEHTLNLNTENLESGIYMVSVKVDGSVKTTKLIKQ